MACTVISDLCLELPLPQKFYQHIIQQVLQGCEGVQNIADDITSRAWPTGALHDQRLTKVLERLQERGLTLNPEKCEFRIPRITFMGHYVSEKGIGPAQAKVEAVLNAREPQSAAEVRSFLGLVNFCSRFIPDFATTAEPLRKLTGTKISISLLLELRGGCYDCRIIILQSNTFQVQKTLRTRCLV